MTTVCGVPSNVVIKTFPRGIHHETATYIVEMLVCMPSDAFGAGSRDPEWQAVFYNSSRA